MFITWIKAKNRIKIIHINVHLVFWLTWKKPRVYIINSKTLTLETNFQGPTLSLQNLWQNNTLAVLIWSKYIPDLLKQLLNELSPLFELKWCFYLCFSEFGCLKTWPEEKYSRWRGSWDRFHEQINGLRKLRDSRNAGSSVDNGYEDFTKVWIMVMRVLLKWIQSYYNDQAIPSLH